MSSALAEYLDVTPDVEKIITEDDNPLVNLPSEKQQRLLTETLYSSWAGPGDGRPFLAAANVGVFYLARRPAIVPDMFLSLDVEVPEDWWEKEHRSYFLWEFGKPPDLAIEIVSNKEGKEDGEKKLTYARMRVRYYVILDPLCQLMPDVLTVYHLEGFAYQRQEALIFPDLGLSLTLWEGRYEEKESTWLRWGEADGAMVLSGRERALEENDSGPRKNDSGPMRRSDVKHKRLSVPGRRNYSWNKKANGLSGWRRCCDSWDKIRISGRGFHGLSSILAGLASVRCRPYGSCLRDSFPTKSL